MESFLIIPLLYPSQIPSLKAVFTLIATQKLIINKGLRTLLLALLLPHLL
jgi:hypothetical protein